MKRLLIISTLIPLLLVSCNKVPLSDILGTWTVENISIRRITSNTDKTTEHAPGWGWFSQDATIVFEKGVMRPDPEKTYLSQYSQYDGTVKYSYSGSRLVIPEVSYYEQTESSISCTTMGREEFDVSNSDGLLKLFGTDTETDNLGNIKSKSEITILLSKQ